MTLKRHNFVIYIKLKHVFSILKCLDYSNKCIIFNNCSKLSNVPSQQINTFYLRHTVSIHTNISIHIMHCAIPY